MVMGPASYMRLRSGLAAVVGLRVTALRDVLDGPGEQVVESIALGAGERGEDVVVDIGECPVEDGEQLLAVRGQGDDRPAPVGAVAAPVDQARVLETVQDRDKVGRVDTNELGQRLLGGLAPFLQVLEREQLPGAQARSEE